MVLMCNKKNLVISWTSRESNQGSAFGPARPANFQPHLARFLGILFFVPFLLFLLWSPPDADPCLWRKKSWKYDRKNLGNPWIWTRTFWNKLWHEICKTVLTLLSSRSQLNLWIYLYFCLACKIKIFSETSSDVNSLLI